MNNNKISSEIFNAEADNLAKLAALFPSAVKDGQLDISALHKELGQFEEVGAERYELTWAGKQAAKKLSQTDVPGRTLKYVPEDSKNADTTENLYIEGDNLEVLKLLRQNYYGAVKMIYIDPPYNTGNDFVYRDKFAQSQAESDEAEGETVDGDRMVVNQKSGNRYHANWLNMIYPRLRIAKDLLRSDGVVFISIDDNEVENLKQICNEIFGVENFAALIPWQSRMSIQNDTDFSVNHEYLLVFAKQRRQENRRLKEANTHTWFNKDSFVFRPLPLDKDKFDNPDNDPRGLWKADPFDAPNIRPNLTYKIKNLNTGEEYLPPSGRCWRTEESAYNKLLADNRIIFGKTGASRPQLKVFYEEKKDLGSVDNSWFSGDKVGTTTAATKELQSLFDNAPFDTPKPTTLLMKLCSLGFLDKNDIILDFFSGSATTAHAVIQLNANDGGNRKFIMVQYPESCGENAKFDTICEIGKERIRRAGDKIKAEIESANAQIGLGEEPKQVPDIGFRVFCAADTNIRWTHEAILGQMEVDPNMLSDKDRLDFMPGYNDIDVVYEIMLRQRDIPLSAKVEKLDIGKRTYLFADAYVVCLDDTITVELVETLAAVEPTPIKYVFRDSAFDDNISLKDETIRRLEAYIARNSGEQKKAYTVEFI